MIFICMIMILLCIRSSSYHICPSLNKFLQNSKIALTSAPHNNVFHQYGKTYSVSHQKLGECSRFRLYSTSRFHINPTKVSPLKPKSSKSPPSTPQTSSSPSSESKIISLESITTPEELEFKEQLHALRKVNATKRMFMLMDDYIKAKTLTPYMGLLTTRAFQRINRWDLVVTSLTKWKEIYLPGSSVLKSINGTLSYVHECSKHREMKLAEDVFNLAAMEIQPVLYGDMLQGYAGLKDFGKVMIYLQRLKATLLNDDLSDKVVLDLRVAKAVLMAALHDSHSLTIIINILSLLLDINQLLHGSILEDYESTQLLASHYLKKIEFLKGAVTMDTLPSSFLNTDDGHQHDDAKIRAEIAFIGRSNVGKSSLINMISNRKSLAYTSKTPGKTSEFNYFAAFGGNRVSIIKDPIEPSTLKPSLSSIVTPSYIPISKRALKMKKEQVLEHATEEGHSRGSAMTIAAANEAGYQHEFYLVDLPGVGFAEATRTQRSSWLSLLRTYTAERDSLRVLFHLIDSRHGALEADGECFELLATLPDHVHYVVVLTKMDKTRGQTINQRIVHDIRTEINQRLVMNEKNKDRKVPILMTSASSKDGGAYVWLEILRGLHYDKTISKSSLAS